MACAENSATVSSWMKRSSYLQRPLGSSPPSVFYGQNQPPEATALENNILPQADGAFIKRKYTKHNNCRKNARANHPCAVAPVASIEQEASRALSYPNPCWILVTQKLIYLTAEKTAAELALGLDRDDLQDQICQVDPRAINLMTPDLTCSFTCHGTEHVICLDYHGALPQSLKQYAIDAVLPKLLRVKLSPCDQYVANAMKLALESGERDSVCDKVPRTSDRLSPRTDRRKEWRQHQRDTSVEIVESDRLGVDTLKERDFTQLFPYPWDLGRPSVTILAEDLNRLAPGQYLNDSLVDFYLLYMTRVKFSSQAIHLFNSFFFKLCTQYGRAPYSNVRDTDIFRKDFLIIPIHHHVHWYLAIVLHPGHMLAHYAGKEERRGSDGKAVTRIAFFDSLGNHHSSWRRRSQASTAIKKFLEEQAKQRCRSHGDELGKGEGLVESFSARVPAQTNSVDCGVFLLHYAEKFLSSPYDVVQKLLSKEDMRQWFALEDIKEKRVEIANLIAQLTEEYRQYKSAHPEPLHEADDEEALIITETTAAARKGQP